MPHFHSPLASFKEPSNGTEGVKFHRASAWKENNSFVTQLTARSAADSRQLGRDFWEETLPRAVLSPFEGSGSFHFNQGEVSENLQRHREFSRKHSETVPSGLELLDSVVCLD